MTIRSENGSASCIVQAADPNKDVFKVTDEYVNISGFTVTGASNAAGIYIYDSDYDCNVSNTTYVKEMGSVLNSSIQGGFGTELGIA